MPDNPLYNLGKNERIIAKIKRHPFGIIPVVIGFGLVVAVLFGLVFSSSFIGAVGGINVPVGALALFGLGIAILLGLFGYVAVYVYFKNLLVITDQSVIEITQHSLFHRDVSQVSMGNVQEITFNQPGLFSHIFHFGTLTVETAGEQNNFVFKFTPKVSEISKLIYDAHEKFIELHPEAGQFGKVVHQVAGIPPPQQQTPDQSQPPGNNPAPQQPASPELNHQAQNQPPAAPAYQQQPVAPPQPNQQPPPTPQALPHQQHVPHHQPPAQPQPAPAPQSPLQPAQPQPPVLPPSNYTPPTQPRR